MKISYIYIYFIIVIDWYFISFYLSSLDDP